MEKKYLITDKRERIKVKIALGIFILMLILVLTFLFNIISHQEIRGFRKITGQLAATGFGIVISMFIVRRIAKRIKAVEVKQKCFAFAMILRKWHAPIAITAAAFVVLHAYIMLSSGIFISLRYISGIVAASMLLVQLILGFLRYKRIGVKVHMSLGVILIMIILIHFFAKFI